MSLNTFANSAEQKEGCEAYIQPKQATWLRLLAHKTGPGFSDSMCIASSIKFITIENIMCCHSRGHQTCLPAAQSPSQGALRAVRTLHQGGSSRANGDTALSYALQQYLFHYHTERNHQGLNNHLITWEGDIGHQAGPVMRRKRLGGLLIPSLSTTGVYRLVC
jgi:hypothetical protein